MPLRRSAVNQRATSTGTHWSTTKRTHLPRRGCLQRCGDIATRQSRVVVDNALLRPSRLVKATDRSDRYAGTGEHVRGTEPSAPPLDAARLPMTSAIPLRCFTQLICEKLEREDNFHDELSRKGCLPASVRELHNDVSRPALVARVHNRELEFRERLLDAAPSQVTDDLRDELKRNPVAQPQRNPNLDEIRERPQADMPTSARLADVSGDDALVEPIPEPSLRDTRDPEYLFCRPRSIIRYGFAHNENSSGLIASASGGCWMVLTPLNYAAGSASPIRRSSVSMTSGVRGPAWRSTFVSGFAHVTATSSTMNG
jgi:hypothetical protein